MCAPEIEEAHRCACDRGEDMYDDPGTKLLVFTAVAHLRRGKCCGNGCRHCPFRKEDASKRPPKTTRRAAWRERGPVVSGDGARGGRVVAGFFAVFRSAATRLARAVLGLRRLLFARRGGGATIGGGPRTSSSPRGVRAGAPEAARRLTDEALVDDVHPSTTRKPPSAPRARKKSGLYTRRGDAGRTRVLSGVEVAKFGDICEAMGEVDELGVKLGLAAHHAAADEDDDDDDDDYDDDKGPVLPLRPVIREVQHALIDANAVLCALDGGSAASCVRARSAFAAGAAALVCGLEDRIDAIDAALPPLANFIVPSGGLGALTLHDARVVCRRAERHVWRSIADLDEDDDATPAAQAVARYLNRLSDFLFAAARLAAHNQAQTDIIHDGRSSSSATLASPSKEPPGPNDSPPNARVDDNKKKKYPICLAEQVVVC